MDGRYLVCAKGFFFSTLMLKAFFSIICFEDLWSGFLQTYPTPNLWQVSRSGWVPRRLLAWMMNASRRPGQLLTYTWQGRHWSRCSTTEAALDFDGYEDLQDTSNWCRFCVLSLKVIYVQLLTQVLRGRHVGVGAETGGRDFNCWSWWFLGWKYQKMSLNTNHSLHFPFWCVGQVSTVVRKMSCGPSKQCWVSHAVHLAQVFYLQWNLIYNSFVLQAVMNTYHAKSFQPRLHKFQSRDAGTSWHISILGRGLCWQLGWSEMSLWFFGFYVLPWNWLIKSMMID